MLECKIKIQYPVEEAVTLRQWMKFKFPHITYERLQQSIRKGDVRVNSLKQDPQSMVGPGDFVTVWDKLTIADDTGVKVEPKFWQNIKVVEKNDDFWVIDKPYGVPTQGGTNIKISLVDILDSWMGRKAYLVHRLDRQTTGLFVVATNSYAARDLSESLRNRLWKKVYHARLSGVMHEPQGSIDYPVFGKPSLTNFKLLEAQEDYNLVEFTPITGRRHQIRQHAAKFLNPLVADEIYGDKSKSKFFLRCVELSFQFRKRSFEFFL